MGWHQGGASTSVALASHLQSISSVVGSNDKIDGAGGPLTQGSVTSGWDEMVHKVKPFSSLGSCFIIYDTCCD